MKTALLTLAVSMILGLGLVNSAQAETPYARECRLSGGHQWSVSVESQYDTTLCVFGHASIGIAELAQLKWGNGMGLSIKALLNQTSSRDAEGICDISGAAIRDGKNDDGSVITLCVFPDGSVVEINTLAAGANAAQNAALVRALK